MMLTDLQRRISYDATQLGVQIYWDSDGVPTAIRDIDRQQLTTSESAAKAFVLEVDPGLADLI